MASKRIRKRKQGSNVMNPIFYVFCEGDTEETYIRLLKSHYKLNIEIKTKTIGTKISQRVVNSQLNGNFNKSSDKIFLFYDLDRVDMLNRLQNIKDSIILASNPCCELWFILHFKDNKAFVDSSQCNRMLCSIWPQYKKGKLTDKMRADLIKSSQDAVKRALSLIEYENPSTTLYRLINELEIAKKVLASRYRYLVRD